MPQGRRRIGLAVAPGFAFFRHILEGVRRYVEQNSLRWTFVSVQPEQRSFRALGDQEPDGLIVSVDTPSIRQTLDSWKHPVVEVGLVISSVPYPYVRADNRLVAELAFEHLYRRGLRHFAFVGHRRWAYSTEREEPFRQLVNDAGFELHVYHTRKRDAFDPLARIWPIDDGVLGWLSELPKPVGVFLPNDLWALQLSEACQQLDINVPEQVAILGVDDDELLCELARPRLSSIVLPTLQIGFEAARLLERLMEGRHVDESAIRLPPSGIATRQSTDVLATDDTDVAKIVRYVREHANVPLSVDEVLQMTPVGRRTIERRLKRFLGHTLGQEITRVHIERAQRLLAESDMSMSEIARHSGFTSGRHLAVVFRSVLGQSATEFRARMRGAVDR